MKRLMAFARSFTIDEAAIFGVLLLVTVASALGLATMLIGK